MESVPCTTYSTIMNARMICLLPKRYEGRVLPLAKRDTIASYCSILAISRLGKSTYLTLEDVCFFNRRE